MAGLIRAFDWSSTAIGPLAEWPQSLKTITGFLLASPVPIVLLWGEDGFMIYNDAYSVFAGGRHPALLGSKVREGWPEVADFNDNVMKVGLSGGTLAYKNQELTLHRHGAPEQVFMNLDYSPVPDESGNPAGVIAIVVETSEQVASERRLAESEERLQLALSGGSGIGTWDWNPKADRVVADERFAKLYGVDPDKARGGAPIAEFFSGIHPDDTSLVREQITRAIDKGDPFYSEYRLVQPDGSEKWVAAQGYAILSPEGEAMRFPGVSFDITERKQIEQKLREMNADLERQVIERAQARGKAWQLSPDLMGVLDAEGRFENSNPAWEATLGWSEDEMAAFNWRDLVHPDDVAPSEAVWADAAGRGLPIIHFENRYRTKSGAWRWLQWVAVPENGSVYFTTRDVTAQKASELELTLAQEALRQSQKMEAVGQLTGGIAHDFNNLLTGIAGSLDMIEKRIDEGKVVGLGRYITAAQASARRAASLTQRLLAFSRRQTLDPKPTDVNRLITGMAELVRRTVGPAVEVEVVEAVGLWLSKIDPSQLENAILNLSINARDAMPDGGRITIETANKWLDARAARERELTPGQYISVCVTDTGTGMTPEVITRAFDPFFTTKPIGQGTGLGLSMIHGFVRQSGGQVRIYSEVGEGTTVCLYLPRFVGEMEEAEPVVPDAGADAGRGETVLVIDDEATIRMLMVEVLSEVGYRVVEAGDGPAGLKILQSDIRIDLLITDVGLPGGMNGRQVADAARAKRPDLKVLFITGYAENAVVGNGHLDAGMAVITKPFEINALAAKVRDIIEG